MGAIDFNELDEVRYTLDQGATWTDCSQLLVVDWKEQPAKPSEETRLRCFSDQQTPQALVLYRPHTHAHAHKLGDAGTSGESSISTNATQSNLQDPGRNLDRLSVIWAENLVSFLSSLAHRTGWGPNAAERRIIAELSHRHTSHIIGPLRLNLTLVACGTRI